MEVIFYANTNPLALAIREETRRPGQPWEDVPSHCAVLGLDGCIYEYTYAGWDRRPADSRDTWRIPVPCSTLKASAATQYAEGRFGGYDYWAVAGWLINHWFMRHVPGLCLTDNRRRDKDCSEFVTRVLRAAGIDLGFGDTCPSPNDVLFAIRTLNNRSLENLP